MLYQDIYALIVPHLSYNTVSSFTLTCTRFRQLFWDSIDVAANGYLPLRLAVMRQAVTPVKLMLERCQGEIPVAVLKLAMVSGNSELLQLLLQHDVEIDDICLCLALHLSNIELFETLLQKAKTQVLHCNHILRFYLGNLVPEEMREQLVKTVRSSPQFRTLMINFTVSSIGIAHFIELNLFHENKYVLPSAGPDHCHYLGIDPAAPEAERIAQVLKIKRDVEENWIFCDRDPYLTLGDKICAPEPTNIGYGDYFDMELAVGPLGQKDLVLKLIANRSDGFYHGDRLYFFQKAQHNIQKIFLETGFVRPTTEIISIMYSGCNLGLLRPMWLKGKALPTPDILQQYQQTLWFVDVAETVGRYWDDVESHL